ncbi:MAG: fluoride efflux transporter CrcB [Rhodanobacter sp.]
MNFSAFLAIALGGFAGSWVRWILGVLLNHLFPTLPPGTLAANLLGGFIMGCMMGIFEHFQSLPAALRLFVLTGFLGSLTTFSTFSAEADTLLLHGQYLWFGLHIAAHLIGSLGLTLLGIFLTHGLLRRPTPTQKESAR